jgi:hypothetical protein
MSVETIAERQREQHSRPAPAAASEAIFDVTMQAGASGLYVQPPVPSAGPGQVGAGPAAARSTAARQFLVCALAALVGGGAVAAIIALKAAIYLARSNYH